MLSHPFWIEQEAAHRRAERDRAVSAAALRAQVAVPGRGGRGPRSWPGRGRLRALLASRRLAAGPAGP